MSLIGDFVFVSLMNEDGFGEEESKRDRFAVLQTFRFKKVTPCGFLNSSQKHMVVGWF